MTAGYVDVDGYQHTKECIPRPPLLPHRMRSLAFLPESPGGALFAQPTTLPPTRTSRHGPFAPPSQPTHAPPPPPQKTPSNSDDLTVGYVDVDRYSKGSKPYGYCASLDGGVDGTVFNKSLALYQKAICPIWDIPIPGGKPAFCPDSQVNHEGDP